MKRILILLCLLLVAAVILGPGLVLAATISDQSGNRTGEVESPVIRHTVSQTPFPEQVQAAEETEHTPVVTATPITTPIPTRTVTLSPSPTRTATPTLTAPPVTTVPVVTVTVLVYPSGPVYFYPPGYGYPYTSSYADGTLVVTSSPSNAVVILDGYTSETTPFIFTGLMPGYHTVEVDYPGYEAYVTSVYTDRGSTSRISADLVSLTRSGSLFVESTPSGADVYVDGNYEGTSTVTVGGLSQGPHQVELHRAGYEVLTRTVSVVSGQGTQVSLVLSPYTTASGTGSIDISSDQPGALVYLDGIYKGSTHSNSIFSIIASAPGSHAVLLHVPGYADFLQTVTVNAGQIAHVDAVFTTVTSSPQVPSGETLAGSIIASSVPAGGQVYLDNQFRGVAPVTIYNVAPGDHIVNMKIPGYSDWSTSVRVPAGQAIQVPATLTSNGLPMTQRAALPVAVLITALVAAYVVVACTRK